MCVCVCVCVWMGGRSIEFPAHSHAHAHNHTPCTPPRKQCVNLSTYEAQKVVTFVPPDGEFELMRYRCQDSVTLPYKVLSAYSEMGRTRLEINVQVGGAGGEREEGRVWGEG